MIAFGLCAVLAASGSSSSSSSSSSTVAGGATTGARNADAIARARVQAASCMRAQGINIPDIGVGGGQVRAVLKILASYPTSKVQAAMQACASSIRQAFPNATSTTPQQRAQRQRAVVVFAQCMRSHGISYPDPGSGTLSPAYLQAIASLDTSSPAYKAAAVPCRAQAAKSLGG